MLRHEPPNRAVDVIAPKFAKIAKLAEREGIAPSYMTRIMRLTLLAPDIVEAILDGRQRPEVTLPRLLEPVPVEWSHNHQACLLGALDAHTRCTLGCTAWNRLGSGGVSNLQ